MLCTKSNVKLSCNDRMLTAQSKTFTQILVTKVFCYLMFSIVTGLERKSSLKSAISICASEGSENAYDVSFIGLETVSCNFYDVVFEPFSIMFSYVV